MSYKFFETYFDSYFPQNEIVSYHPLAGGDIHSVFELVVDERRYAIKVNVDMPSDVFVKESNGLEALRKAAVIKVPEVLEVGEHEGREFLLMEWISSGNEPVSLSFGEQLARLHQCTSENFGWPEDNYIGSLPQNNGPSPVWADFFIEHRIVPRVKKLRDKGNLSSGEVTLFDRLAARYEGLLPKEPPALLHGDLWSGNVRVDGYGDSWLIDPAVYFGHREMDLAMMKLFGGFSEEVFQSYNSTHPLESEWEERVKLNQLYPLLVHAVLFGGHYTQACLDIVKAYA